MSFFPVKMGPLLPFTLCVFAIGCGSVGDTTDAAARQLAEDGAPVTARGSSSLVSQTQTPITLVADNSYCLGVAGNADTEGTRVVLTRCDSDSARAWIQADDGSLRATSSLCVSVINNNTNNGALLQLKTCGTINNALIFDFNAPRITWKTNGKCLDVKDSHRVDGADIQLYDCYKYNTNQGWTTGPVVDSSAATTDASNGTSGIAANMKVIPWSEFTPQKMKQGAVNHEQQAYLTDGSTIKINSKNQLVIKARPKGDKYGWFSGRLTGPQLGASKGYIEAKMKTPKTVGTWPAFWLMNKNNVPTWPQGGEIDIMEQVNGSNKQVMSTHYGPSPAKVKSTSKAITVANLSESWHTFGLAWDTKHCSFYVDGKKRKTVNFPSDSPFGKQLPKYTTILNLAMGGDWPEFAQDSVGVQTLYFQYVAQTGNVPKDF